DADIAWNIRALPVPLVFFTHQNPVEWPADPDGAPPPADAVRPSATDDVLLHRDLVKILVEAAYRLPDEAGPPPPGGERAPALIASADGLGARLRGRRPAFFDADGDRLGGRGEYVIVLRPEIRDTGGGAEVRSEAYLEVWTRDELATAARR